jgi:hypothetical protein
MRVKRPQYAVLKGEFEAIEMASQNNDCGIEFITEEKTDES